MNQNLFAELSLVPELLRAIGEMGFSEPTPIQAQSIPLILEGRDVVGRSQTGTGKTAAFGIPAIQMVDPNLDRRMAQILLLCPTRELAVQACEELKKLAHHTRGVHVCAVYGGAPIERQIVQLKDANIVVGTPGRVMDHLRRRTLKISELRMVILDEADEMLSMGFREDIETILTQAPENPLFRNHAKGNHEPDRQLSERSCSGGDQQVSGCFKQYRTVLLRYPNRTQKRCSGTAAALLCTIPLNGVLQHQKDGGRPARLAP